MNINNELIKNLRKPYDFIFANNKIADIKLSPIILNSNGNIILPQYCNLTVISQHMMSFSYDKTLSSIFMNINKL